MAFTLEDGTGVASANAYVSESYADTYHSDRGHTAWASLSSSAKQTAIIRASEFIDLRFGGRFKGFRLHSTQGLEWPRYDVYDDDDNLISNLPSALTKACAEYALRGSSAILAPDPPKPVPEQTNLTGESRSSTVESGLVVSKSEGVGSISESQTLSNVTTVDPSLAGVASKTNLVSDWVIPEYPMADLWMRELLKGGASRELRRG